MAGGFGRWLTNRLSSFRRCAPPPDPKRLRPFGPLNSDVRRLGIAMRRYLAILGLSLLVAVIGCSQNTTAEDMFKIENPITQRALVEELEKRGIPSRVDEDNRVWFPSEHQVTVNKIAIQLMESAEPDRESFTFAEPEYTEMLIARFHSADVPFSTEIKEGVTYVVLDSKHKPQWAPIKKEVEDLFVAEKKRQLDAGQK